MYEKKTGVTSVVPVGDGCDRSTAIPVLTQQVNVTATGNSGAFQLTDLTPGSYDVTFKLRAVEINVTITQDEMTPVNFGEIILGDTWGDTGPDNVIDISDYSATLNNYGSTPEEERYTRHL